MIGKRVGQKVPSPLDRLLMDIPLNRIVIKVGNAGPYLFVSDPTPWGVYRDNDSIPPQPLQALFSSQEPLCRRLPPEKTSKKSDYPVDKGRETW